jgi:hypothetical protein
MSSVKKNTILLFFFKTKSRICNTEYTTLSPLVSAGW